MKPITFLLAAVLLTGYSISAVLSDENVTENPSNGRAFISSPRKSSRTIERLVGGHLQHPTDQTESTQERTPPDTRQSKIYFRRRRPYGNRIEYDHLNKSFKDVKYSPAKYNNDDDAGLLDEGDNTNNWDSGILRASAGAGKETEENNSTGKKKEDGKKTLADQVAEGKYGLIQKEIFEVEPKRPGVISYLPNPEVPTDNNKNYGGLDEDDIWLAEDHLLVLKGGNLNKPAKEEDWRPIDDYVAPLRQVKIPENPRVPPPFPVQLEENGPIQFIGDYQIPLINPFTNESLYLFPNGGFPKTEPYSPDQENIFTGQGSPGNSTNNNQNGPGFQHPQTPPLPPWIINDNQTFANPFLNNFVPFGPAFPLNGSLENSNFTDYIDEDDPSLYYPPPYSFVYKNNYTNPVPPGPIVPGIILPPPPNFFGRLNTKIKTTTPMNVKSIERVTYRPTTKLKPHTTETPSRHTPIYYRVPETTMDRRKAITTTTSVVPTTRLTTTTIRTTMTTTQRPIVSTTLRPVHRPIVQTPEVIAFVPQDHMPPNTKSNPVYYEYFDARKGQQGKQYLPPPPVISNAVTSPRPQTYKQPVTKLRPAKPTQRPYNAYLPVKPFDYENYLYITPKPEILPNGVSNFAPVQPTTHSKLNYAAPSVQNPYNREIETIRQTLQYYKAQPTYTNNQIPRTPKSKAVYEFSFDASNNGQQYAAFNPPSQIDTSPFKPMVQYSPPLNSDNGFKAMSISSTESSRQSDGYSQREHKQANLQYLPAITTDAPIKDSTQSQYYLPPNRQPTRFGQKINPNVEQLRYNNVPSSTPRPWVSVEKQLFREIHQPREMNYQQQQSLRNTNPRGYLPPPPPQQSSRPYSNARNPNNGYEYNKPQSIRLDPQQDAYFRQVSNIRQQLRNYPQQQQNQQYQYSLVNDTNINYRLPLRPVNSNSESVPQAPLNQQYSSQAYRPAQLQQQTQRLQPQHNAYGSSKPIPLHNDVLVNYKNPLPTINPDAEFISAPQVVQNNYRQYQSPVIRYRLPGDQAGVYFVTPQEPKYKKK